MRRKITVMFAALSVVAAAGTALAATVDTLFTEGYDDDNHNLVWGAAEVEGATWDCTVANDTYGYEANADGEVTALALGGVAVTYQAITTTSTATYGSTGGECDLVATNVEGPNGQVNHGQVVSNFRRALRDAGWKGAGCLVSIIGQSDYGKGDQQVQVPEVTTTTLTTVTGEVDLTTHELTCQHGNPHAEDTETSHGKPEWAGQGKPPWAGQGGSD